MKVDQIKCLWVNAFLSFVISIKFKKKKKKSVNSNCLLNLLSLSTAYSNVPKAIIIIPHANMAALLHRGQFHPQSDGYSTASWKSAPCRLPVALCTKRHGSVSRCGGKKSHTHTQKKAPQNCFNQVCFCSFYPLFVCIICVGIFLFGVSSFPRCAFLARLQGFNESISSKHVDFCFHGDPEGLTMSPRLRPTGWWKTLLHFSIFYSHCVPPFLFNSLPLLQLLFLSATSLFAY